MADPRIIVWDLESLPNLPEALRVWPAISNTPGMTLKASISTIICAGWKPLGSDRTECICAWDFPEWIDNVNDDKRVVEAIAEVLRDADCVITHNGKRFDWPFLQTRLLANGLDPLPRIHHVDTCQTARSQLSVANNRLQTVARFLTDKEKKQHEGWDLWVRVHSRDPAACEEMKAYCMQDVDVLEQVFRSMRPLVRGLPNQNLFSPMKENSCPQCGSTRLRKEGKRYTSTGTYQRYICTDCRTYCRTDLKDQLPRTY